jgi:hypothetical protein
VSSSRSKTNTFLSSIPCFQTCRLAPKRYMPHHAKGLQRTGLKCCFVAVSRARSLSACKWVRKQSLQRCANMYGHVLPAPVVDSL